MADGFGAGVFASARTRHALELCRLYARFNRPVLFLGPVGAGKSFLAEEVHHAAKRPGRFVTVGAGEMGETLYTDTLFGHVPGAFTGARAARRGAIREAAVGTILLDDIALMPIPAQAALLRVLETGRFRPLGAPRDEEATCRFLFASTVDPVRLVDDGRLLPDLESRLGDLRVHVPPLTDRTEEIPVMAKAFALLLMTEHRMLGEVQFDDEAMDRLTSYDWPGNVRELKAVVERAVIHAASREGRVEVLPSHLPPRVRFYEPVEDGASRLSAALVEQVLRESGGNRSEAARRLGVHRNTIARYLRAAG